MSNSVRPQRWQPTRLLCPWDSPGKNTGVGCHFLLQCTKVKSESKVAQSCPTLSNPMDRSLPGSSIHGIFQARVLEWGAIAFSVCFNAGPISGWQLICTQKWEHYLIDITHLSFPWGMPIIPRHQITEESTGESCLGYIGWEVRELPVQSLRNLPFRRPCDELQHCSITSHCVSICTFASCLVMWVSRTNIVFHSVQN